MTAKKVLILLWIVFLSAGAFALFDYSGNDLATVYSAGEKIRGTINISFADEQTDSVVRSNLEGNITLKELLDRNGFSTGQDYDCNTQECRENYVKGGSVSSLGVSNQGNLAGLVLSGQDIGNIQAFEFNISGNSGPSCLAPLIVDILDDRENVFTGSEFIDESCSTQNGCFQSDLELSDYQSAEIPSNFFYCNKIDVSSAPAYRIGAVVQNSSNPADSNVNLIMSLFDSEGELLGSCNLPKHSQQTESLSCIVEHSSPARQEYFVCIGAEGPSGYKIRSETKDNVCGNNEPGSSEFARDYEIFASNLKFAGSDISVNEESFQNTEGISLSSYIENFVSDFYGSLCSPDCVIPVRFSGTEQDIDLSDVKIKYDSGGAILESNSIFEIEREPGKISSDFLEIELEHGDFTIPVGTNDSKFELFINNKKVFEEELEITESFDFDIIPKFVGFGQNVQFTAQTTEKIESSRWIFGDGRITDSEGNSASHRYLNKGTFKLEVELTRDDGIKSKRTFSVIVGNAEEVANSTIKDYKQRISDIKPEINSFPSWISSEIKRTVDPEELDVLLSEIERRFESAVDDSDYEKIVLDLIDLKIPRTVKINKQGKIPLAFGLDSLNTAHIEEISGNTNVQDRESLRQSIISWMDENYDPEVDFELISAFYDEGEEPLVSKFRIRANAKPDISDPAFLIINFDINEIRFMKDYSERGVSGGTSIPLEIGSSLEEQNFEFAILGEVKVDELGSYISPQIGRLGNFEQILPCNYNNICEENIGENPQTCRADCKPVGAASAWIITILVAAFVVYIILQEWYKRHYEKYLFKKQEYLYNLINFVYNARKQGLKDRDIRKKLENSGWKGEQITYVLKKIDGKRTGMLEIPIFKFLENRKVRKELMKRQKKPLDARFIKRSAL